MCIPEDADDLLNLRRVLKKGDKVVSSSTRKIKQEKEFSRPDKGERVKIQISLSIEKVSFDKDSDRLRIHGIIEETNNDLVARGTHHSIILKLNERIKITKQIWKENQKKILQSKNNQTSFILIAIDRNETGIGKLKGTHLHLMPNIYSGVGGKRYKTKFSIENFFYEVQKVVLSLIKTGEILILFGPGDTKNRFANFLKKNPSINQHKIITVEGIDSGGEEGIYLFTRSQAMKEILSESKFATVLSIIDNIMVLANKKSEKFTMGFEETRKGNEVGAIDSLVYSEKIFQDEEEEKIIDLLNEAEEQGAKIFGVDSSTDIGLRVSALGGIIALLRFPLKF